MDLEMETNDEEKPVETCSSRLQNVLITGLIVALTVSEAEFTQETVSITGAFFLAWLASCAGMLSHPIWWAINRLSGSRYYTSYSDSLVTDKLRWPLMIRYCIFVSFTQTFCVYCYMAALHRTTAEDMITLYNTSCVFIFVAGLIFLDDKLDFWKYLAVVLSMGGAVFVAYGAVGVDAPFLIGERWQGDLLALGSALFATVDLVCTKKVLGDDTGLTSCNLVLVLTGVASLLLQWPIILLFDYTGVEPFRVPTDAAGWGWIAGSVLMAYAINWLFTIGVAFMDPLFVTIAGFLAMPISALFDWILHGIPFTWIEAIGTVLVILGFSILNFDVHAWLAPRFFASASSSVSVASTASASSFLPADDWHLRLDIQQEQLHSTSSSSLLFSSSSSPLPRYLTSEKS